MKLAFGKCPCCEKEIMQAGEPPVRLPGYATFWIAISDGSKMQVAICETCRENITDDIVADIMEAHREAWKESITSDYERNINYYYNLKPIKHGLRERDIE